MQCCMFSNYALPVTRLGISAGSKQVVPIACMLLDTGYKYRLNANRPESKPSVSSGRISTSRQFLTAP